MRLAALDMGSNSFHLLVVQVREDGGFLPLTREKEMLRLGDVVTRHGYVTPEAEDRAVAAVRRLCGLADAAGAEELVVCATSAIREAANSGEVVDRIREETGVRARVIGGLEEARLIFRAVQASILIDPGPALALDLGGGSLEVMVGDARALHWARSAKLGVARLTAELVRHDPASTGDRKRLEKRVDEVLEPLAGEVAAFAPRMVVGTSGTFCTLARMIEARRSGTLPTSVNQLTVTRAEIDALADELASSSVAARRRLPGLDERRADLILAGAVIAQGALRTFAGEGLTVGDWALREGMVLDAIDRHDPTEFSGDPRAIRRASVLSLCRRCGWDEVHSSQVARLALQLFDGTAGLHRLGGADRELLEYGALLHDIGEHVSPEGHHKHTAYLIEHGRLRGFEPAEVAVLATLGRYHLRGDPKAVFEPFGRLDTDRQRQVRVLVGLLRVADGLDRSHAATVGDLDVMAGRPSIRIVVGAHGDPELEVWGARRKLDLLERALGRPVMVDAAHPGTLARQRLRGA